jgi:hypothetical protein
MTFAKKSLVLFTLSASAAFAVAIPVGTKIQLRLTKEASSEKPPGQPVSAVVIAPVIVGGSVVIGFGAVVPGNTADAQVDKPGVLTGCTVTVCEHLDGRISVRWGPHLLTAEKAERDVGKDGALNPLEISPQISAATLSRRS